MDRLAKASELYREKAASLLERAREAENMAARMAFLALAEGWDEMAERFDRTRLSDH